MKTLYVSFLAAFVFFIFSIAIIPFANAVNPGKLPEAASFNAPPGPDVDLFGGGMQLGIPLLVVPGRNNFNYPVALNYQAGIKVEQEASWVGLGWSFSPGSVQREMNGVPDDYKPGFGLFDFRYKPNIAAFSSGSCEDGLEMQERLARWSEAQGWKSQSQMEIPGDDGGASDNDFLSEIPPSGIGGIFCSGGEGNSQEARGFLYTMPCSSGDSAECVQQDFWSVSGLGVNGRMFIEGDYQLKDKGNSRKAFHMYNPQGRLIPSRKISDGLNEDAIKIQYGADGPNGVIDSFTFTLADGTQLIYDLPLYYTTKDGEDAGEANNCDDEHVYKNVDKAGGVTNCELLLHRFAYTWMLTKIIDANGNAITFNYEKSKTPFRFRAPYGSDEGGGLQTEDNRIVNPNEPALHQSSKPAFLQFDDVASGNVPGNAADGWMETAYLKSVETDTHIAEMIISKRKDNAAYDDKDFKLLDGDGWFTGENSGVKLDGINLFIKDGNKKGEKISGVEFTYDYSLQQGIPNFNPRIPGKPHEIGEGKLTLKGIQQLPASGKLLGDGSDPQPYLFEYGLGEGDNPSWEAGPDRTYDNVDYRYDYFGYFWKDGNSNNHIIADRYYDNEPANSIPKYVAEKTDINHADAWSLSKIAWPTGATTKIEYEINKYSAIGKEPTIWSLTDGYVYRGIPGRLYDIDEGIGPATPAVGVATLEANTCGGVNVPNLDLNYEQARGCFNSFLQQNKLPETLTRTNKLLHYGGGIRVKKIIVDDGDANSEEQVTEYFYRLDDAPFDGYGGGAGFVGGKDEDGEPIDGKKSSGVLSKPYYNLLTGQVPMMVGYRRVIEKLPNQAYIVHDFTSPYSNPPEKTDNPNQGWGGQFGKDYFWDPYDFYFDTSYLWGFEYKTSLIDSEGKVIASTERRQSFEEQKDEFGKPLWEEILKPSREGDTAKVYGIYPLWTRLDNVDSEQDGVATNARYYYNAKNGLPFLTIQGEELGSDARVVFTRYSDENNLLRERHILNKPVEQRDGVQLVGNAVLEHGDVENGKNQIKSYISWMLTEHDSSGNPILVKQIDPNGLEKERTISYEYDDYGNVLKITDARGFENSVRYWRDYLPEKGWDARKWSSSNNPVWRNEYDEIGRIKASCDANNACTQYVYDDYSRLIKIVGAGDSLESPSTKIQYQLMQNPLFISTWKKINEDRFGNAIAFFDGLARTIQVQQQADGSNYIITGTDYNKMNKPEKTYKAVYGDTGGGYYLGRFDEFMGYDYENSPLARVWRVRPYGSSGLIYTETEYGKEMDGDDAMEYQITLARDENGNEALSKRDHFGGIIEVKMGDVDTGKISERSYLTKNIYDALGRLILQQDVLGRIANNEYNSFSQVKKINHPDAGVSEMKYDENGNLIERVTPLGIVKYQYDAINRLSKVEYLDSGFKYYYDLPPENSLTNCENGKDKLCMVEGEYGKTGYDYDERGRVVKVVHEISDKKYEVRYEYDSADNIIEVVNPEGVITQYSYDDAGRLKNVFVNGEKIIGEQVAAYNYNPTNTIDNVQFGNNVITKYGYNVRDWLESINTYGNMGILSRKYGFDNVGNILSMADGGGKSAGYGYDKLYRLVNVADNGYYGGNIEFGYDALGNRQSMKDRNGEYDYGYDYELGGNTIQLRSVSGGKRIGFDYDAAGNMIMKNENKFIYDAENKMRCFDDYAYAYDASGNRVKKIHFYDKDKALVDVYVYDASGNLIFEESKKAEQDDWKSLLRCSQ